MVMGFKEFVKEEFSKDEIKAKVKAHDDYKRAVDSERVKRFNQIRDKLKEIQAEEKKPKKKSKIDLVPLEDKVHKYQTTADTQIVKVAQTSGI